MAFNATRQLSPRQQQIVDVARDILEREGRDGLTMRHLADELGIKAPSLYKHFPDKQAVETALIVRGFLLWGNAARDALELQGDAIGHLAAAYRAVALGHPHLYRLMTGGALDRVALPPGLEEWSGAPLGEPFCDPETARAFWGFLHGMAILEIDGRFPPGVDLERSWTHGIAAFRTVGE